LRIKEQETGLTLHVHDDDDDDDDKVTFTYTMPCAVAIVSHKSTKRLAESPQMYTVRYNSQHHSLYVDGVVIFIQNHKQ
jgi:hypothetical protein